MHCIILTLESDSFPYALRPVQGRAAIDYIIDDIISQKDIKAVSIVTNNNSTYLLNKHIKNVYPHITITVLEGDRPSCALKNEYDILLIQRVVHTSLKLQDFIRYFKQFKTTTNAIYDKINPKEIPFIIIPKNDCENIDSLDKIKDVHTYNSGTGYCTI